MEQKQESEIEMKEKIINVEDLNQEKLGYIQFSITKDGYYRCGRCEAGESHLFKKLLYLARHFEEKHLHLS